MQNLEEMQDFRIGNEFPEWPANYRGLLEPEDVVLAREVIPVLIREHDLVRGVDAVNELAIVHCHAP